MILRMLKQKKIQELADSVPQNLKVYRSGDFGDIALDPASYLETAIEVNEEEVSQISCTKTDDREIENCIRLYKALPKVSVSPYLARDQRLWGYLTHVHLLEYARTRWPIPSDDEKAVKHIRTHFFIQDARSFERDNASSRLWWMAYLCDRVQGMTLERALTLLLHMYDVRANIVERPTTSQSEVVFSAILKELDKSFDNDKSMFERVAFREIMRKLNLRGGVKLLEALPSQSVVKELKSCM